jgi:glycyl-tRNA synthetase alpha chain
MSSSVVLNLQESSSVVLNLQDQIINLQQYWITHANCCLMQPYDLPMGAGTSHPATFFRSLSVKPWQAVYVQPCRRPTDGRYGIHPNRLGNYYQMQVILKPAPTNIQELYLQSLAAIGIDIMLHDIRFVTDNWENPSLGAAGVGWEIWLDGMEISQFTYFQQVGDIPCSESVGEITYGLERLAMYVQQQDSLYNLMWNNKVTYADIFKRAEFEQATYSFCASDVAWLSTTFDKHEQEALRLITGANNSQRLILPAYDMLLHASHIFNLLEARGAISVAARVGYISRLRTLANAIAQEYVNRGE